MSNPNFYYDGMAGAPAGASGSLQGSIVAILDACLVNGFNSHTITTSVTESGTTVTVVDTAHGFKNRQLVTIAGATPSGYNGTFRITVVDADTFTYQAAASLGSSSGTITAKTPGRGWSIAYTASNQRAYRAGSGNQFYLSVDDSAADGTYAATVRGYQTMTDAVTGADAFPDDATLSGSPLAVRWMRPLQAGNGSTNYGWCVIADEKRFFLGCPGYNTGKYRGWMGFGDFTSYLGSDAFNSFIAGDCSHGNGAGYYYYANFPGYSNAPTRLSGSAYWTAELGLARGYDGATDGVAAGLWSAFAISAQPVGNSSYNLAQANTAGTPNPITGGIDLTVLDIIEKDTVSTYYWRRGRLPGILACLGAPDYANNDAVVSTGIPDFTEVITFGGAASGNTYGLNFALCDWDAM